MNLRTVECDLVLTERRAEREGPEAVIEEFLERLREKALEHLAEHGFSKGFLHFKLEIEPYRPEKGRYLRPEPPAP